MIFYGYYPANMNIENVFILVKINFLHSGKNYSEKSFYMTQQTGFNVMAIFAIIIIRIEVIFHA